MLFDVKTSSGFSKSFQNRHKIREIQVQSETLSGDSNGGKKLIQIFNTIVEKERRRLDSR